MTGFWKTVPNHTITEIHSIAYHYSHTQVLPRHSIDIAVGGQVCFYRRLFADPFSLWKYCWALIRWH